MEAIMRLFNNGDEMVRGTELSVFENAMTDEVEARDLPQEYIMDTVWAFETAMIRIEQWQPEDANVMEFIISQNYSLIVEIFED